MARHFAHYLVKRVTYLMTEYACLPYAISQVLIFNDICTDQQIDDEAKKFITLG